MAGATEEFYVPEPNSGCWLWVGGRTRTGYGIFHRGHTTESAHRAVYREHRGEIPSGLELDHKCRNKSCVNPDHLEPVTRLENMRRWSVAVSAARESRAGQPVLCRRGHLMAGRVSTTGKVYCRVCNTLNKAASRKRGGSK